MKQITITCLPLLLALLFATATAAAPPGLAQLPVHLMNVPAGEPVIEYDLQHHMLAAPDPVPLLRVYGNGRVHVHVPAYMKNAGDFEMQLTRQQLSELVRQLDDNGIIDFDPAHARSELQQLAQARRSTQVTVHEISDATDTHIRVRLDSYQRTAGSPRIDRLDRRFSWRNLEQDARNFPAASRITRAASAADTLRELCRHPALVRIP